MSLSIRDIIEVVNSGVPLKDDQLKDLFNPFYSELVEFISSTFTEKEKAKNKQVDANQMGALLYEVLRLLIAGQNASLTNKDLMLFKTKLEPLMSGDDGEIDLIEMPAVGHLYRALTRITEAKKDRQQELKEISQKPIDISETIHEMKKIYNGIFEGEEEKDPAFYVQQQLMMGEEQKKPASEIAILKRKLDKIDALKKSLSEATSEIPKALLSAELNYEFWLEKIRMQKMKFAEQEKSSPVPAERKQMIRKNLSAAETDLEKKYAGIFFLEDKVMELARAIEEYRAAPEHIKAFEKDRKLAQQFMRQHNTFAPSIQHTAAFQVLRALLANERAIHPSLQMSKGSHPLLVKSKDLLKELSTIQTVVPYAQALYVELMHALFDYLKDPNVVNMLNYERSIHKVKDVGYDESGSGPRSSISAELSKINKIRMLAEGVFTERPMPVIDILSQCLSKIPTGNNSVKEYRKDIETMMRSLKESQGIVCDEAKLEASVQKDISILATLTKNLEQLKKESKDDGAWISQVESLLKQASGLLNAQYELVAMHTENEQGRKRDGSRSL